MSRKPRKQKRKSKDRRDYTYACNQVHIYQPGIGIVTVPTSHVLDPEPESNWESGDSEIEM